MASLQKPLLKEMMKSGASVAERKKAGAGYFQLRNWEESYLNNYTV